MIIKCFAYILLLSFFFITRLIDGYWAKLSLDRRFSLEFCRCRLRFTYQTLTNTFDLTLQAIVESVKAINEWYWSTSETKCDKHCRRMWQVQIKGRFEKEKETRGKFPIPLRKWWKIGQSRFFLKILVVALLVWFITSNCKALIWK